LLRKNIGRAFCSSFRGGHIPEWNTTVPPTQALSISAYLLTHMADKANKTLSLSRDVIDRLEQEDNQSGTVDELLKEYYDL